MYFPCHQKAKFMSLPSRKHLEGNVLLNYKILEGSDLFFIIIASNMIETLPILIADFQKLIKPIRSSRKQSFIRHYRKKEKWIRLYITKSTFLSENIHIWILKSIYGSNRFRLLKKNNWKCKLRMASQMATTTESKMYFIKISNLQQSAPTSEPWIKQQSG